MGTYNTYIDGEVGIQLKIGDTEDMKTYKVGDVCDLSDGVYIGYEGAVAVKSNKVVLVTENVQDKYGCEIDCEGLINPSNPIFQAVQQFKKENK